METWKTIEGFESYEVSDKGNVRKIGKTRNLKKQVIKGVAKVSLTNEKVRSHRNVNRLVAQAFKPELASIPGSIANLDGDPTNNSVGNLGEAPRENVKYFDTDCSECEKPAVARGFCQTHYSAWYRANVTNVQPRNYQEIVGYVTAHQRLQRRFGRASTYTCDCGQPAEDWALLSLEADVLYKQINLRDRGRIYSLNPEDYTPMCAECHRAYDKVARGDLLTRFQDCIEVSVKERAKVKDWDYEALTQAVKEAGSVAVVSASENINARSLAMIFAETEGIMFSEWKRQQKGAA